MLAISHCYTSFPNHSNVFDESSRCARRKKRKKNVNPFVVFKREYTNKTNMQKSTEIYMTKWPESSCLCLLRPCMRKTNVLQAESFKPYIDPFLPFTETLSLYCRWHTLEECASTILPVYCLQMRARSIAPRPSIRRVHKYPNRDQRIPFRIRSSIPAAIHLECFAYCVIAVNNGSISLFSDTAHTLIHFYFIYFFVCGKSQRKTLITFVTLRSETNSTHFHTINCNDGAQRTHSTTKHTHPNVINSSNFIFVL